jgi:hypothetical protein
VALDKGGILKREQARYTGIIGEDKTKLKNIPSFMPAFCKSVSRFLAAGCTPLKREW